MQCLLKRETIDKNTTVLLQQTRSKREWNQREKKSLHWLRKVFDSNWDRNVEGMSQGALEGDPSKRGFLRCSGDAQREPDGLFICTANSNCKLGGSCCEDHILWVRPCYGVGLSCSVDVWDGSGYRFGSHESGEGDRWRVEIRGRARRLWAHGLSSR